MRRVQRLTSLVLGFFLCGVLPAKAEGDEHHPGIVGTWVNTVLVNTGPGAPPLVNRELSAFSPGGILVSSSATAHAHSSENPYLPPPLAVDQSDGYGSWERQEDGRISLTFKRWLFAGINTPSALYPSAFLGQQVGIGTVQGVAALRRDGEGDILEGAFTFRFVNLAGKVVFAGGGTFSARRLKIEPLQ